MELKELGSVCDLKNGYAFKSDDYIESSNTVSLRMSNIRPGGNFDGSYNLRFLPDNFQDTYSKYLVKDGDLVIAMTDLANDPKILGIPTIVNIGKLNWLLNQRAGKLEIIDESKANKHYLRYILNHPIHRSYYKKFAGGGLQINVGKKEILGCKIPLPPLTTQKRIAQILDNAAALRDKTQQLLAEYDQLAQSIFLEMFGDTYSNPKNFPIMLIEELAAKRKHSIKAGPFGSSLKKEFYVESGYKIYGQEQVIKDDLNFGDYYIDEDRFQKLKSCAVSEGDILVSLVGTYGKISVVPKLFEPGIINPRLMKISPNQDIIRPDFLKTILKSDGVAFQLKNKSRGGTMDIINVGIIRKVRTLVPPIELQNQFAEKIALIEQQKALAKQELQQSEDLFNCLLQKAFKGELV
ncbi:MAG: hypothetical protein GYB35_03905 [Algicola sp.]|nr:hypothetical protein [Algicola sp.]